MPHRQKQRKKRQKNKPINPKTMPMGTKKVKKVDFCLEKIEHENNHRANEQIMKMNIIKI